MQVTTHTSKVREFACLIQQGIDCWTKAGEIIVELIDECGMTLPEIAGECDGVDESILARFEQIGRKQILPRLLVDNYPAASHLMRLPYSEQRRLADDSVDLMVDGDVLRVAVKNLTPSQCKQVFARNAGVRDVAAQRAWLESEKAKRAEANAADPIQRMPYEIRGKSVLFRSAVELSASDLSRILAQLTR